jgi:hypothetical protein
MNSFEVTAKESEIRGRTAPVIGGQSQEIPDPTHCPNCRQQRRLSFRNDSNYYKNTCHFCKKQVISIYSPDKPIPVLCHTCFWSDQWEGLNHGQTFDAAQTFFAQYGAMRAVMPRLAIFNTQSENSEYTVHSSKNRNCYMDSSAVSCENVYFSDWPIECRDSSDLLMCNEMELSYSCHDSRHCYNGDWLRICANVSDSLLCFDCQGSKNLAGCVSLRGKENMILNQPATKEEVQATIARFKTDRAFREEFQKKFDALLMNLPKRETWNLNAVESSGDSLMNTKAAERCYHCMDLEDCANTYHAIHLKDCCDVTRGSGGELLYDCKGIIDLKNSIFCNLTYQCDHLLYCDNCHGCSDCFGCFGLKRKKYCILNTQYTKEEYETLVRKIIAHMRTTNEYGEFFPTSLSPFGYNESRAQEYFPMTQQEVEARGWQWSLYQQEVPESLKMIETKDIPENIAEIPDDILNVILRCEVTGKPFRLIPQELAFYRQKGLPVPRRCPQQRLRDLAALQNPYTLWHRTCAKCGQGMETTYSPQRPEIVYCEKCYLETVY